MTMKLIGAECVRAALCFDQDTNAVLIEEAVSNAFPGRHLLLELQAKCFEWIL